jgi:hypothetical protein
LFWHSPFVAVALQCLTTAGLMISFVPSGSESLSFHRQLNETPLEPPFSSYMMAMARTPQQRCAHWQRSTTLSSSVCHLTPLIAHSHWMSGCLGHCSEDGRSVAMRSWTEQLKRYVRLISSKSTWLHVHRPSYQRQSRRHGKRAAYAHSTLASSLMLTLPPAHLPQHMHLSPPVIPIQQTMTMMTPMMKQDPRAVTI